MRNKFRIMFAFTLLVMVSIIGVYIYIGAKVVDVIQNPTETGKTIGKYVEKFEEGVESGRGDIGTYDTINKK